MPYEIETKDGIVIRGIPDDVKPDDPKIRAKVTNARQAAGRGDTGATSADRAMADPTGSFGQNALAGAGKAFSDLGRGVKQVFGANNQAEIDDSRQLDKPLMATGGGVTGNIAGNVAATLPAMAIPGVNGVVGGAALGAGLGAAQPVATGESRGENMAIGAAGGAGGQMLANTIGRVARPVQSQLSAPLAELAAKAESQYGIPLNAAQRTGSRPLKIIDSVLENLPLTADRQALAKELQRGAFNKATLQSIGESSDLATPEVLNAARTRIGGQFNDLAERNSVKMGDDFLNSLVKIDEARTPFSSPTIQSAVDKGLELAGKGEISGREYQKVRTVLGKASSDAYSSGNSELGQALKTIKGSLDDAATASVSPADKAAWDTARQQWQSLKVVEKAAAPTSADAVAGNVSPAKLAQALNQVDKKGFTYGTRGGDLPDLARIGQAFIKDQIPNSGTAQRQFYQRLMENPISALIQGAAGGVAVPVQALLHSKAGQRYFGQGPASESTKRLAEALRAATTATAPTAALEARP